MMALAMLALAAASVTAPAPAAQATALPEPIALGSSGRMQCFSPDRATKTCAALAGYTAGADGAIARTETVLLSRRATLTMVTVSPVTIRDGRLCATLHGHDIEMAGFALDGAPVDEAKQAALRKSVLASFQDIVDHEICTRFAPDGSAFDAQITMDGLPKPGLDQTVIWVSAADGYKVAPRSVP